MDKFITEITTLKNERQLIVIGAAVVDVIADAYSLPYRGSDIELHQQSINVGGCALNVAITIQRLGMQSVNALPIGQGIWSDIIQNDLKKKNIHSITHNPKGDNGWCLALVEPDGERTFLSVSGVENQWNDELLAQIQPQKNALIYLSGYQLASASKHILVNWLETLDADNQIFIDFGPRIADIDPAILTRLLNLNVIITLNRQEAEYIQAEWLKIPNENTLNIEAFTQSWYQRYNIPLIIRVDKEGAFYSCSANESGYIQAFPTEVIDTIGAGDSHAGAVISALAANWPLSNAVKLGNAVASFVVNQRGGDSAPTINALQTYLEKY